MLRNKDILLVDDESSVLLTLRMVVEGQGYDVTTAQTAPGA